MENQMAGLNVIDHAVLSAGSATAVSMADATPALALGKVSGKTVRRMFVTVETGNVRWRADGTAPTAATGHVIAKDDNISWTGANYKSLIGAIQFIGVGSTCPIQITYFE